MYNAGGYRCTTLTSPEFGCHHLSSLAAAAAAAAVVCREARYTDRIAVYRPSWWWSGVVVSTLTSINEVNQRRARLVLRWVTVSGFNSRCGTFISVCDQPPSTTQPGHPFVGRCNEYQPKIGDALRLVSKGRYGSYVCGR